MVHYFKKQFLSLSEGEFKGVFHSMDVWHKVKNIGKKIAEAAKYKSTRYNFSHNILSSVI